MTACEEIVTVVWDYDASLATGEMHTECLVDLNRILSGYSLKENRHVYMNRIRRFNDSCVAAGVYPWDIAAKYTKETCVRLFGDRWREFAREGVI